MFILILTVLQWPLPTISFLLKENSVTAEIITILLNMFFAVTMYFHGRLILR